MSGLQFRSDLIPGFKLTVEQQGKRAEIACSGSLDAADPMWRLQPELLHLHEQLVAAGVEHVRMDMQTVEYMNSSGIKCFMAWFLRVDQAKTSYLIEVVYDPGVSWQYVSFTTMARIA